MSDEESLVEQTVASFSPKIDGTPLAKFDAWKAEVETIDLASGPSTMRKLLQAYEWTCKVAVSIHKRLDDAIEEKNHQEALAKLERFGDYYEKNKEKLGALKDSASLRDMYLSLDEGYRKAAERVNMLKALSKFMDNKADSYRTAHDDAKKIYDKVIGRTPPASGTYGFPKGAFGEENS